MRLVFQEIRLRRGKKLFTGKFKLCNICAKKFPEFISYLGILFDSYLLMVTIVQKKFPKFISYSGNLLCSFYSKLNPKLDFKVMAQRPLASGQP